MKKNKVCMKKSEFNNEHRGLIKLLRSAKGKKFKKEADEQEKEMRKYNESAPIFVVGIRLCEGPLGSLAIRAGGAVARNAGKIGRALWNRKGDIAAMALGAAGARKAGRFLGRAGADAAREIRQAGRAMGFQKGSDESRGWNRDAASVRATTSGIRKKMAGGKGMLAGALGALATKKAIGFAGRTALRAGKWAKRKILGEGFGSQMSGLMSRVAVGKAGKAGKMMKSKMRANQQTMNWRNKLMQAANKVREAGSLAARMAVAKGGNAGQTMRSNMKVRQTKQTLKPGWKTKMVMSIRKKFGGA